MKTVTRHAIIVEERRQIVAQKITEFLKGSDRFSKTIVFCVDIEHAEGMRKELANANSDLVATNNKYVMQITGDNEEGKRHLDAFISPSELYPVIATTSKLMTTGVDAQSRDLQKFKMRHWGHDEIVLHEHEIRKLRDAFSFLMQRPRRERFLAELTTLMQNLPATIVAVIIDKNAFTAHHLKEHPGGTYDYAMETGLNAVFQFMAAEGQSDLRTHVIVERRGRKEDKELELTFRRFCDITNSHSRPLPFDLVMVPKSANSTGLQLADLIARPIGLHHLRPQQPNRSFDIIRAKLHKNANGDTEGFGLLRIT